MNISKKKTKSMLLFSAWLPKTERWLVF